MVQSAFENDREYDAECEEQDRQSATAAECLGNDVHRDDAGDRYEDEAVENLPRHGIAPAQRVHDGSREQGEDTESEQHIFVEYTNGYVPVADDGVRLVMYAT